MLFSKEINRQKKCQTLPFEKQRRSQNLSEKYTVFLEVYNLKKRTRSEEQKGTRYIRGNNYFSLNVFSCLSSTKSCLIFPLICFAPWTQK